MNSSFSALNPVNLSEVKVLPEPELSQVQEEIKSKFQRESNDSKTVALTNLEEMFATLNEADAKKAKFMQLYGMIVGRYGSRLYPVFEEALPYLQTGLQMQLQDLRLIQAEDFSSSHRIEDFKKSQILFQSLNNWLQTTDEKMYPELLKLADDEKLAFARTLLRLGETYSNISTKIKAELKLNDEEFLKFKTRFHYGIKELLSAMDQTLPVQKELGELYYNILPGLYLEKCKLITKKDSSLEEIEESFKIRWEAAKYNPAKSMHARIHNLKACYLSDFKDKMQDAKEESLKSVRLWEEVILDPDLTSAEKELYKKLSLNAKSVYGYILRESGAPIEELEGLADTYREFYQTNQDRDPYSMIHLMGLCKLELHKNNKEEVLKWIDVIEQMAQKYQGWSETVGLLKQAQELKSKAQQILSKATPNG
jgi:hypothetical protein